MLGPELQARSEKVVEPRDHFLAGGLDAKVCGPLGEVLIDGGDDGGDAGGVGGGARGRVSDVDADHHGLVVGYEAELRRFESVIGATEFEVEFECYVGEILVVHVSGKFAGDNTDAVHTPFDIAEVLDVVVDGTDGREDEEDNLGRRRSF